MNVAPNTSYMLEEDASHGACYIIVVSESGLPLQAMVRSAPEWSAIEFFAVETVNKFPSRGELLTVIETRRKYETFRSVMTNTSMWWVVLRSFFQQRSSWEIEFKEFKPIGK